MFTEPEFRKPWFRILSVREKSGRSIADIAKEVCTEFDVPVADVRGPRTYSEALKARREFMTRVFYERPDLSSNQVAIFLNKEGSTVRHFWRGLRAMEAV